MKDLNEKINYFNHNGTAYPTRTLAVKETGAVGDSATYILIGVEDMELDYEGKDYDLNNKFYWWVNEDEIKLSARELLHTLKLLYGEKSTLELATHQPNLPEFFSGIHLAGNPLYKRV